MNTIQAQKIPFVHYNDLLSHKLVGIPTGRIYHDGTEQMRWEVHFQYPTHTTRNFSDTDTQNYRTVSTLKG